MADNLMEGVVITPDGLFYSCEHCTPGTSFGNLIDGITSEEKYKAFSEISPVADKCRSCVLLPECTTFSKCPIKDFDCYRLRKMNLTRVLHYFVSKSNKNEDTQNNVLNTTC